MADSTDVPGERKDGDDALQPDQVTALLDRSGGADEAIQRKVQILKGLFYLGSWCAGATIEDGRIAYPLQGKLTDEQLRAHVQGECVIAASLVKDDKVKAIHVDFDTRDTDVIKKAVRTLESLQIRVGKDRYDPLQVLVSRSGKKGFHIWIPLKGTSVDFAQALARHLGSILEGHDRIAPFTGNERSNLVKLPLGLHPETGNATPFVYSRLPDDALSLKHIDLHTARVTDNQLYRAILDYLRARDGVDPELDGKQEMITGNGDRAFPSTFPCVERYLKEGLEGPPVEGRRHNVTVIVGNELARQLPHDKQEALRLGTEWVKGLDPESYESTERRAIKDMERQIKRAYQQDKEPYRLGCKENVFAPWLKDYCDKGCCVLNNTLSDGGTSALDVVMFSTALTAAQKLVYHAHCHLAWRYRLQGFEYQGQQAYYVSFEQLGEMACCTRQTASKATKKLIEWALVEEVPKHHIPQGHNPGTRRPARWYIVPSVSEGTKRKLRAAWQAPWEKTVG